MVCCKELLLLSFENRTSGIVQQHLLSMASRAAAELSRAPRNISSWRCRDGLWPTASRAAIITFGGMLWRLELMFSMQTLQDSERLVVAASEMLVLRTAAPLLSTPRLYI